MLGVVAFLTLILVIALGFVKKINAGVLAIAAAMVLSCVTGEYTTSQITGGFSGSLFITVLGLTLFFGIITVNGCLDIVMQKAISRCGRHVWIAPILFFVSGWLVSALAGGFAGMAFTCGLGVAIAKATGYNPFFVMLAGNAGAQAGRYTVISPDGNIVLELLEEQGIYGGLMNLTINMTIAMAIMVLIAFVFFKGYQVTEGMALQKMADESLSKKQWIALGSVVVLVVAIIGFGLDAGLTGLTMAVLLMLFGIVDEKTALSNVPWNTIVMVTGVGVLMKMVINLGGIDVLTDAIASVTNNVTVSAASCMTAGVMSWFSSTLGVVVPTLTPTVGTLAAKVGGSVKEIGLLSSMLIGSSSACWSPASSVGGLILATVCGDPEYSKKYDARKMFTLLFCWSVFYVIVSSLLSLVGLYQIFA